MVSWSPVMNMVSECVMHSMWLLLLHYHVNCCSVILYTPHYQSHTDAPHFIDHFLDGRGERLELVGYSCSGTLAVSTLSIHLISGILY